MIYTSHALLYRMRVSRPRHRKSVNDSTFQDPRRFVNIEGGVNFRDFGGYQTRDGRCIKWGILFRCGTLARIPPSHHRSFADLDIGMICDLRRIDEAENAPSPISAPFLNRVHIPIGTASSPQMREALKAGTTSADLVQFMTDITREIASEHHDEYATLFQNLLKTKSGFLLHCSAGKDRTGLGAALIMSALDVDEETIVRDYLLSNRAVDLKNGVKRMKERYGWKMDDDSLRAILGVYPEYLNAAMDEIHKRHGSVNGYLDDIGVDQSAREELRNRLLA